jgi:hypothetical protein
MSCFSAYKISNPKGFLKGQSKHWGLHCGTSPSGLCPPSQFALLKSFAHRAGWALSWMGWEKPLGLYYLRLDHLGLGRARTATNGHGHPPDKATSEDYTCGKSRSRSQVMWKWNILNPPNSCTTMLRYFNNVSLFLLLLLCCCCVKNNSVADFFY